MGRGGEISEISELGRGGEISGLGRGSKISGLGWLCDEIQSFVGVGDMNEVR